MPPHSAPASFGGFSQPATSPLPAVALDDGLARGRRHLLGLQRPDGHWCAELEGDTILESEFILLQAILGRLGDPRIAKCARYLIAHQQSDGGWNNYPGGASDLSVTAKAYFALKIAGLSPDAPAMTRARQCVHSLGGAENVNSFTRFYFALLGQIPYSSCPTVPPELVLLPKWFPLSIYKMSSWSRTIVVPLALVQAHQPVTPLPANLGIKELFRAPGAEKAPPPAARIQGRFLSWQNFFRLADRGLKVYEKLVPVRWRRRAIKAAEKWMIDRFEGSDGLGAIFPPMVYAILALKALGYPESSAEFKWAEKQLDDLIIEENDAIRVQPCVSPVWDTAIAAIALADAGTPPDDPSLTSAADWLLAREIREPGDWSIHLPHVPPSGWAFEYRNRFYPDLDDTAMVLLALRRTARYGDVSCQQAVRRAVTFLEAMRSSDNGWAAFDKDIDNKVLEAVPFADHNAMLDPTCADITARVLEMFGDLGRRRGDPMVDAAVQYLLDRQEPEGCWYGRWGVNYIYGTWQALLGLAAVGYDMRHPKVRKAVDWLVLAQQSSGGWGESADTYIDRNLMGKGPATASQTGWAVMGLIAAGDADTVPCRRGVEYLLENQRPDGSWDEPEFTGTGFPKVFYLRYHYYRNCFPLLALGRYRAATAGKLATTDDPQVLPMNRRA
ncbi:MAG TPA: squalene--hopene cyclase [Planctomycetia bacterium]|nr:squalene--hopene cyclase [Planctomycetia bacterium]